MTVKTTGTELKRFYFDEAFWPDGAWHEDEEIEAYGSPLSEDIGIEDVPDNAVVKITGGVVLGLPDWEDDGPSFEAHFKRWRKAQNAVSFVVECAKDKEEAVRAAIRATGGRIT
jgi:hypothetical protein